ncbi:LOW QUALITY PROTEIN: G protein pathway suppressor 2-like, partial [Anomaloglossus baeobatrachus]
MYGLVGGKDQAGNCSFFCEWLAEVTSRHPGVAGSVLKEVQETGRGPLYPPPAAQQRPEPGTETRCVSPDSRQLSLRCDPTMPALLERPKLSNTMARALHKHVMMAERKRQEEEEVDKMMEQKLRDEQERRRKKEMEERMSLEETREQIMKLQDKLNKLQEEKHQLFLQLKKVLHEEEKRRRKEQSDLTTLTSAAYQQGMVMHTGTHIINMQ